MSAMLRRARPLSWVLTVAESCPVVRPAAALQHPGPGVAVPVRSFGTVNIILTEDLPGKGYKGEEITVRGGYMRNLLFPSKKAVYATEENRTLHQSTLKTEDKEKIGALKALKGGQRILSRVDIWFKRHAPTPEAQTREVAAQHVSDFLKKSRQLDIPPENIDMQPITQLGEHDLRIQVTFADETKELLKAELGAEEFERQSWVEKKLTIVKR